MPVNSHNDKQPLDKNGSSTTVTRFSQPRSGSVQYHAFTIEVPDSKKKIDIALGYRRCHDFDEGNLPGQDFAIVRGGDAFVVGVVTDGVSQSFYGNIAAERVAQRVLDTLWARRSAPPNGDYLESELRRLESEVAPEVSSFSVPNRLPEIQIGALETSRRKGSQAVFAAFILDGRRTRVFLYQVGDVCALVHHQDKQPIEAKAPAKGRWSSTGASTYLMVVAEYAGVTGIVIKSDGMSPDWGRKLDHATLSEGSFLRVAQDQSSKDDVSFVSATLQAVDGRLSDAAGEKVGVKTRPPQRTTGGPHPEPPPEPKPEKISKIGTLVGTVDEIIRGALATLGRATRYFLRSLAFFLLGLIFGLFALVLLRYMNPELVMKLAGCASNADTNPRREHLRTQEHADERNGPNESQETNGREAER